MARNLRLYAGAAALVLVTVSGPSHSQDRVEGQLSIPFSSLSASAQQEILLLQQGLRATEAAAPVTMSTATPGVIDLAPALPSAPVFADDRRARIGWTIGVYR